MVSGMTPNKKKRGGNQHDDECRPLLEELRGAGSRSINALAKQLHRHYKNVYEDVRALERLGLIERNSDGLYTVPWDEVVTTIRLAA